MNAKTDQPAETPPKNGAATPPDISFSLPRTIPRDPPKAGKAKRGAGWLWTLLILLVVGSVVAFQIWRRSQHHEQLVAEVQAMALPTVLAVTPQPGPEETEIALPGNLTAYSEAPIYARTNGYLKAWYTDIGAKVTQGQLMAEITAPDVDAQLRESTAKLAQEKANLDIAQITYDRDKALLPTKSVSQQEVDQDRSALDAHLAALKANEANVENLNVQQGFQKLIAPFPGIVTRRNTDVGALINAGSGSSATNNTGGMQELFHIARTDILRVFIFVPEVYSSIVTVDTPAYLELAEFPGEKFQGKIAHIAGAIDPASRTLLTEVQVPNADGRLFPGAFANVHLVLKLKNRPVVIPSNTLLFRKEGVQVGVVDDADVIHLKKIVIGRDFGTSVEVVSGLEPKAQVVVNPSDSLTDGLKVRVEKPAPDEKAREHAH